MHLNQWKQQHPDAGLMYDRIQRMIAAAREPMQDRLQALVSGNSPRRELPEVLLADVRCLNRLLLES